MVAILGRHFPCASWRVCCARTGIAAAASGQVAGYAGQLRARVKSSLPFTGERRRFWKIFRQ